MKNKITLLAVLAALTIAGQASAQTTLLLSDSFDTAGDANGSFNGGYALGEDQAGALAPLTYSITQAGGDASFAFQRGNDDGGSKPPSWLMYANQTFGVYNMSGSVNNNFATQANTLGQALEFSFNMTVVDGGGGDTSNWSSFGIGSTQNAFVADASNKFASIFRQNGNTQQFGVGSAGSAPTYTAGQQIKFVISDASGAGSAFNSANGATDMVKMYIGGTLASTFQNLNFGADDGYMTFMTYNAVSYIDNLSVSAVTAIPEPSSALLAGLGALSLVIILHRRRAQA